MDDHRPRHRPRLAVASHPFTILPADRAARRRRRPYRRPTRPQQDWGTSKRRSDAIRHLRPALATGAILVAALFPAPATAAPTTPASLVAVHHWYAVYHQARVTGFLPAIRYGWLADRHSTSAGDRWLIARRWYERARAARLAVPWPAWFHDWIACISVHEEYGVGGSNTRAGKFGFIAPPATYVAPVGAALARVYGYTWLSWPVHPQVRVAWELYRRYGGRPWSTASLC